jgi:hypothetical protein
MAPTVHRLSSVCVCVCMFVHPSVCMSAWIVSCTSIYSRVTGVCVSQCKHMNVHTWMSLQLLWLWKLRHISTIHQFPDIISHDNFLPNLWVAIKKVDNLKHFPLHVEMDYNPNLIKTLNDSLATLGFSSGQPTSQRWRQLAAERRRYSGHYMLLLQQH